MKFLLLFFLSTVALADAGKESLATYTLSSAVSLAADYTSAAVDVRQVTNVDFMLHVTGTPTGTFSILCALGNASLPGASPVFKALSLSPAPAVSGSAKDILLELNQTGCKFLKLQYTAASSTGTLTAEVGGKNP